MTNRHLERERKFRTYRLHPVDRELLKNIGRGREEIKDRHHALLELVDIVRKMEIPEKQERDPIRIGIPIELWDVISERVKPTKQTFQDILLMAARIYREKFPWSEKHDKK